MTNQVNPCTQSAISCFWEIEKRNSNIWLRLSCLKEFYTVPFSFFIFMKELKNELLKNIKIDFMVISQV